MVVFFAVTLITLTHVIATPRRVARSRLLSPSLPAALRSLGGFDQSFDASNPDALAQVGQAAAAAVIPNLDGAIAERPVNVTAAVVGQPAAVVVPLTAQAASPGGMRLVGLVSFYVGCGGRAYFGSVTDVASPGPSNALAFPTVGLRPEGVVRRQDVKASAATRRAWSMSAAPETGASANLPGARVDQGRSGPSSASR